MEKWKGNRHQHTTSRLKCRPKTPSNQLARSLQLSHGQPSFTTPATTSRSHNNRRRSRRLGSLILRISDSPKLVTWRSRRSKQLARIYWTHYWTLMEELKVKHKEYYWKYGKSPYKEDEKNKKRKRDFNNDKEIFELNAKLGIRDGGGEAEKEKRGEERGRVKEVLGCWV